MRYRPHWGNKKGGRYQRVEIIPVRTEERGEGERVTVPDLYHNSHKCRDEHKKFVSRTNIALSLRALPGPFPDLGKVNWRLESFATGPFPGEIAKLGHL